MKMYALCAIGCLSSQIITNSVTLSLSWEASNSRHSAYCPNFMKLEGKLLCSQQPARWIQSTCTQIISLMHILILSSHPHLRLPSCLFPSGFPNKTLQAYLSPPIRATFPAISFVLIWSPVNIWWELQLKNPSRCSFCQSSVVSFR